MMFDDLRRRILSRRTLIMGVGNRLRQDDAVGPLLIDRLQGNSTADLLDTGDTPENYIGVIEAAKPELILVVDAVDMGRQPGELELLGLDQLSDAGQTTHNASLSLVFKVLQLDPPAEILILAIQPASIDFGESLSTPVQGALTLLEQALS